MAGLDVPHCKFGGVAIGPLALEAVTERVAVFPTTMDGDAGDSCKLMAFTTRETTADVFGT
jgi:hypothetical protein